MSSSVAPSSDNDPQPGDAEEASLRPFEAALIRFERWCADTTRQPDKTDLSEESPAAATGARRFRTRPWRELPIPRIRRRS
jgi:hypothetical protein